MKSLLDIDDAQTLAILAGMLCAQNETLDYASALVTAEQRLLMAYEYISTEREKLRRLAAARMPRIDV